jgi:hypothetical protein
MKPLSYFQELELEAFKHNGGKFRTFNVVVWNTGAVSTDGGSTLEIEKKIGRVTVAIDETSKMCQFAYCPVAVQYDKGGLQYVALCRLRSVDRTRKNGRFRPSVAMRLHGLIPISEELRNLVMSDVGRKKIKWMKDVKRSDLL